MSIYRGFVKYRVSHVASICGVEGQPFAGNSRLEINSTSRKDVVDNLCLGRLFGISTNGLTPDATTEMIVVSLLFVRGSGLNVKTCRGVLWEGGKNSTLYASTREQCGSLRALLSW